MKNTTRKVLILKNVNSELIEQAILILKDSAPDGDSKVNQDAEKIVEKYMETKSQKLCPEKKPKTALLLSLSVAFISLSLLAIAFFA